MVKDDFDQFCALVEQQHLLSTPRMLPASAQALFFAAMAEYSLADVERAILLHIKDPVNGKFPVQPAHLVAHLGISDGRPGAEEAWATALMARDQRDTVVWTAETFAAFEAARPVLEMGDEVGARMAFKDAYSRLVGEARQKRQPVAWQACIGWDASLRERALSRAQQAGLLPAPMVEALLPAPEPSASFDEQTANLQREQLDRIRKLVAKIPSAAERIERAKREQQEAERARLADLKSESAAKVRQYATKGKAND